MSHDESYYTRYDELISNVFTALAHYQDQIAALQDVQNDGFDLINDAERQAGIFSTQFNSSSYFNAPLSSRYEFKIDPQGPQIISRPLVTASKTGFLSPTDLEKARCDDKSDDNSDDDNDVNHRIYTPQQLMTIFALAPSKELSQAQEKWSSAVEINLPAVITAKTNLIKAIEEVENFKSCGCETK